MTAPHGDIPADPVLEQAMAWRAEAADPAMPEDRARLLESWLRAPEHARAYGRAERLWRDLGWSQILNEEALAVEHLRRPVTRPASVTRRRWLGAGLGLAAASVVGAVLIGQGLRGGQGSAPAPLSTAVGEIRQVTLEDGSRLTLGGGTVVTVSLTRDHRRVEIESGDAWFEVTPDADRPFSVQAGDLTATVLGTVFEVRRNPRGAQVAVVEGRVRVEAGAGAMVLTGGQGVRRLGQGDLTPFDVAGVGRWREQRFSYRNAPLSDMVEDLNRYHAPGVRLARPGLGELRVSAAFRLDQLETALNGLALSHDLTVTRTADGAFVLG